jgi:hypothetical protein
MTRGLCLGMKAPLAARAAFQARAPTGRLPRRRAAPRAPARPAVDAVDAKDPSTSTLASRRARVGKIGVPPKLSEPAPPRWLANTSVVAWRWLRLARGCGGGGGATRAELRRARFERARRRRPRARAVPALGRCGDGPGRHSSRCVGSEGRPGAVGGAASSCVPGRLVPGARCRVAEAPAACSCCSAASGVAARSLVAGSSGPAWQSYACRAGAELPVRYQHGWRGCAR